MLKQRTYWLSGKFCESNEIEKKALGIIGRHLDIIQSTHTFLGLRTQTVIDLLLGDSLQVPNEIVVYEAMMAWIKHDIDNREEVLSKLLDVHRLSQLPAFYLINVVGKESLIQNNMDAFSVYSSAIKLKLGDDGDFPNIDRLVLVRKKRHHFIHGIVGKVERMMKTFEPLDYDPNEHERLIVVVTGKNECDESGNDVKSNSGSTLIAQNDEGNVIVETRMNTNVKTPQSYTSNVSSTSKSPTQTLEIVLAMKQSPTYSNDPNNLISPIAQRVEDESIITSFNRDQKPPSSKNRNFLIKRSPAIHPHTTNTNTTVTKSPRRFVFKDYDYDLASVATEITKNVSHPRSRQRQLRPKFSPSMTAMKKETMHDFKQPRQNCIIEDEESCHRVHKVKDKFRSPRTKQQQQNHFHEKKSPGVEKVRGRRSPSGNDVSKKHQRRRRRSLVDQMRQNKRHSLKQLGTVGEDMNQNGSGDGDLRGVPSYCCDTSDIC